MDKRILLTAVFVAQILVARAQIGATPASPHANAIPPRFSVGKQDTMRALGNMYVRYAGSHRAGKIWAGIGLAFGLAALRIATTDNNPPNSSPYGPPPTKPNYDALAVAGGILGGIPLLIGVSKMASGPAGIQDSVVARYARRQPLPAGVVRRLGRKDFD